VAAHGTRVLQDQVSTLSFTPTPRFESVSLGSTDTTHSSLSIDGRAALLLSSQLAVSQYIFTLGQLDLSRLHGLIELP
jgi:hypothetical protein